MKMEWYNRYEDGDIFDLSEEEFNEESYFDNTDELLEQLEQEEIEKSFSEKRGAGVEAHAYRHNLDNNLILQLWRQGWTLRKIGKELKCSPNTVRYRLHQMGYDTSRNRRK